MAKLRAYELIVSVTVPVKRGRGKTPTGGQILDRIDALLKQIPDADCSVDWLGTVEMNK